MRPLHHLRQRLGVSWSELPAGADGVVDPDDIARMRAPGYLPDRHQLGQQRHGHDAAGGRDRRYGARAGRAVPGRRGAGHGHAPRGRARRLAATPWRSRRTRRCSACRGWACCTCAAKPTCGPGASAARATAATWYCSPRSARCAMRAARPTCRRIVGLDAALDWFEQTGVEHIEAHCAALISELYDGPARHPARERHRPATFREARVCDQLHPGRHRGPRGGLARRQPGAGRALSASARAPGCTAPPPRTATSAPMIAAARCASASATSPPWSRCAMRWPPWARWRGSWPGFNRDYAAFTRIYAPRGLTPARGTGILRAKGHPGRA